MRSEPITSLSGIGRETASKLAKLGIRTCLDLILHLPTRYQDRTTKKPLSDVRVGDEALVQGVVTRVTESTFGTRRIVAHFRDESAASAMVLFNFNRGQRARLVEGCWLRLFGKLQPNDQFVHPEYLVFNTDPGEPTPEFRPVYRTPQGITSYRLAEWIRIALREAVFLPKLSMRSLTLAEALHKVHTPDAAIKYQEIEQAFERIAFEEMIAFILIQRQQGKQRRSGQTIALASKQALGKQLLGNLGFELTKAQKRVTTEVLNDLSQPKVMRRLLQGDVGSGKTVVAAFGAIRAAENGVQTAIMAPTELLAEQHHETFSSWLTPLGINVGLLTGRMSDQVQRRRREAIANGDDLVAVGTHALFQEGTQFDKLGLAIIDEQHRFGVHQRMQLHGKGRLPHQLIMTATPIPRTLELTMFANIDVSRIDEMPPGRMPITTTIHSNARRDSVIRSVRRKLENDEQVYWVCTSIEDREDDAISATETVHRELTVKLGRFSIGHVTGRMKTQEKQEIMNAFRERQIQMLVATTVIEVGIDVPNATLMVIEDANRLGLAQLHQLRGRVGRSSKASHCMLLYSPPLPDLSRDRLLAIKGTNDGFDLAELDLKMRGPGQVFGTRQSGLDQFKFADLHQFIDHFAELTALCDQITADDQQLAQAIVETWTAYEPGYISS